MASPNFPEPPAAVPATPIESLDQIIDRLDSHAQAWVDTPITERIELLDACLQSALNASDGWVDAACRAKGLSTTDGRCGEEWLAGPMALTSNIRMLREALKADGAPKPKSVRTLDNGQKVVQVFPADMFDAMFFTGFKAEVYIEPGKEPTQGALYRKKAAGDRPNGGVALVLGAGNVASIGPMDALYKLFVDDEVVIVKTNPVNAYLG